VPGQKPDFADPADLNLAMLEVRHKPERNRLQPDLFAQPQLA
jgi:hypothetical protein